MARLNERCVEHTSREMGLATEDGLGALIPPGQKFVTQSQDVMGAKILVMWVKTDGPARLVFECLSKDGILLEEMGPFDLEKTDLHKRFQFGTYRPELTLPIFNLRLRFVNTGTDPIHVTANGMSQLQ